MARWLTAVLVAASLLLAGSVFADASRALADLHLEVYQKELPQNSVHAILQSRDGYLWIATFEGVVRTDGINFMVFDRQSTHGGIAANGVVEIYEDRDGALWFGTVLGGVTRYAQGSYKHWGRDEGLEGQFASSIREARDGTVWVGTSRGLFTLSGDKAVRAKDPALAGLVRRMISTPEGDLLVGFDDGRLLRVSTSGDAVNLSSGLPGSPVYALAVQADGSIWVGTDGGGLYQISKAGVSRHGAADGLTSEKIRALMVDPDGSVWVGTEGGGLNRITNGKVESLRLPNGLPNELVRAIYRDREGTVWLGTNGGGLVGLKQKKFVLYTKRRGLSSDAVRTVLEARDGSLWIGTDGGGVNVIRDGTVIKVLDRANGFPGDFVRSLLETRDGTIWIGTNGAGLIQYREGRIRRLTSADGLPSDTVFALADAPDGTVWIGSNRGVTSLRDGVMRTIDRKGGLLDNNVRALQVEPSGKVWAGTAAGLHTIENGQVSVFPLDPGLDSSIFCVKLDPDGTVWIGSDGGLARIRGGQVFDFDSRRGMPDEAVFEILEDRAGFFWLSGNRGIRRVARAELESVSRAGSGTIRVQRFGRGDGMHTNQCNGSTQPAGWEARDGRLWFPSPYGVVAIDPANLHANPLPPPVSIETLRVDGVPRANDSHEVVLKPGTYRIEFDYAAMSFVAPESVRFKFRLQGLDSGWIDAGARRTAFYTNVGPGEYRFQVIAANNDGVWNDIGESVSIRIKPFLWQEPFFILAMLALGVALLWVVMRLRVHEIDTRRRELEHLVEDRTVRLEQANLRLQQLSITDSLTGAANRRHFDETFEAEWRRAIRSRDPLSLLMIDVDRFKDYNDEFGHQRSDECLRMIAEVLMAGAKRIGDLVARYGGEEFAVILPATPGANAFELADRLREAVERIGLPALSGKVVTISIGVATMRPTETHEKPKLIAAADEALHDAKHAGRNRVVMSAGAEA